MKREVVAFRKDIQPNETGSIKERLKYKGMIEEIRIRFYPGVERSLKVRPYVLHDSRRPSDLFTFPEGTETNINGDDDYLIFPSSLGINYDDELIVDFHNTDPTYVYTLVVDVIVSYDSEVN